MAYFDKYRICPYCGVSPIKATEEMTQEVGQRDGQLYTKPSGGNAKPYTKHDGMTVEGINATDVVISADVFTEDDSGEITIGFVTNAGEIENAFHVSGLNDHVIIHAEIRGGILFCPANGVVYLSEGDEYDGITEGITKITSVTVTSSGAENIKIYER